MSRFLQLRLLWRGAAAHPGFTLVALATLAVGIGANVAIFTVVNAVVLRPLPVPDSERLVMLRHAAPGLSQLDELPTSDALHFLYADESRTLDGVAAYRDGQASFTGPDDPQRVQAAFVTASFFDVVRTSPRLGRAFTPEDDRPGAAPVLVLGDGLWRTRFGADPGVVGTVVDVDGRSVEVVGVMPPGFSFSRPNAELWRPLALDRDAAQLGAFGMNGVARIAGGSTLEQVRAELGTMISNLAELLPDQPAAPVLIGAGLAPVVDRAREVVVGDIEATLWILLGAVGFLLLIACANVANLFLVRSEARHGEVAVRSALGEGRGQLVGSVFLESVVLGLAGGLASLPLALLAVRLVVSFGPQALPRLDEISVDATVLLFGLAVSVVAGLLFGVLPAWRATAVAAAGSTTAGARGATAGRERQLARRGLVVVQIALALTLLVGSGLAVRSFQRLAAVDPGFDPRRRADLRAVAATARLRDPRVAARLPPPGRRPPARPARGRRGGGGDHGSPRGRDDGVGARRRGPVRGRRAGGGAAGLHVEARLARLVRRDGHRARRGPGVRRPRRRARRPRGRRVADGGAGAVAGRERPRQGHPPGRAAARGRGLDPRRRRGRRRPRGRAARGPAGDGVLPDAGVHRGRRRPRRHALRGARPPTPPPSPARRATRCAASTGRSPSPTSRRWRRWWVGRGGERAFVMVLLVIAAALALLLGSIGLYGVVSYLVAQRGREIAIRMAVGAQVTDVRRLVLVDAGAMALIGVVLGAGAAVALTRRLQALLFETAALDPVVFLTVSMLLAAICLLASWLPARRAAGIDPMSILRAE